MLQSVAKNTSAAVHIPGWPAHVKSVCGKHCHVLVRERVRAGWAAPKIENQYVAVNVNVVFSLHK